MNRQQKLVRDFNRAINTDRRETPGMPSAEVRLLRARLILEETLEVVQALGFDLYCDDPTGPTRITMTSAILTPYHCFDQKQSIEPDMVEVVDGLCDIKYVVDGTADALGVDLDPFFEEVHYTNMQKLNGPKDANGKQLKPEGWHPPRIADMLKSIDNVPQDQQNDTLSSYLLRTKAR